MRLCSSLLLMEDQEAPQAEETESEEEPEMRVIFHSDDEGDQEHSDYPS